MGAVNIDNTGSGASVTLSSDGTDLLLNGSPIGGGGGGASLITISNKTSAYTVVSGDLGTIINCTSTLTISLDAAATLGAGFNCWIWNTTSGSASLVTIDPNGAETIDGVSAIFLRRGEGCQIICDGTNWQTGDKKTMRGYAENLASGDTRPVASGSSAIAMGPSATASGAQSFSAGGWAASSGLASIAIGGYNQSAAAASQYSTAFGNNSGGNGSKTATGAGAMALGGSYASGTDSFAAAVANNTSTYGATGPNSVAIGYQAKATTSGAQAFGYGAVASGTFSTAIGGSNIGGATASGTNSVAIGTFAAASTIQAYAIGPFSIASANSSVAIGTAARSDIIGKFAFANGSSNQQGGYFILNRNTTDATPTVLTTNNSAPGSDDQVILFNFTAFAFTGIIAGRQQASGGTASAAWKIEGLIRREANAASTTLVASTVTVIDNTPGWTLALSADTTNGGLKIEVTGAAATNIRWVATVQTSEVTYA